MSVSCGILRVPGLGHLLGMWTGEKQKRGFLGRSTRLKGLEARIATQCFFLQQIKTPIWRLESQRSVYGEDSTRGMKTPESQFSCVCGDV